MKFLEILKSGNIPWLNKLLLSAIILGIGISLYFIVFFVLKRFISKANKTDTRLNLARLKIPSFLLFLIISLKVITLLTRDLEPVVQVAGQLLTLLIIISLAWLLIRLVRFGRERILQYYDVDTKDNLKARRVYTQFRIIERLVNFIIIILAISAILMSFDSIRKLGISLK